MHITCVATQCNAEAKHIVSSSKHNAGYGSCTPHLGDIFRIVAGWHKGRISVCCIMPTRRTSSVEVTTLTSRRQHRLAS